MKKDAIQQNDALFSLQMLTFANEIGAYVSVLNLSPAQITALKNDASYFDYTIKSQSILAGAATQATAWKNIIRNGGTLPSTGAPVTPNLPVPPAAVEPGIESRFRSLVQQIKANPNYNEAVGKALGIEGAQQSGPDLTTLQPKIAATISGNQVFVDWGWGGNSTYLDLCEIQVDRGDGKGFVLLTFDTTPGYTDTQPLPATPTKWTYRAIYRVADAQVGKWSNPVTVTVGA